MFSIRRNSRSCYSSIALTALIVGGGTAPSTAFAQRDLKTILGIDPPAPSGGNKQGGGGCGGGGGGCHLLNETLQPADDCDLSFNPVAHNDISSSVDSGGVPTLPGGPLPIMGTGGSLGGVGLTQPDARLSGLGNVGSAFSMEAGASRIPGELGFGQVGLGSDPVIAGTGEYVFKSTDMTVKHDGTFISIGRVYRSLTADEDRDDDFGPNFHSNLWIEANEATSTKVEIYLGTGPVLEFNESGGTWVSPTGYERYLLEKIATTGSDYYYQLTDNNGYRYIFEEETSSTASPYMLDRTENRFGQGQTYNYSGGRLRSITCNDNLTITITRDLTNDDRITKISDSEGREVNYEYQAAGDRRLIGVSDLCGTCGANTSVSFDYDGDYIDEIYNGDDDLIRSITYASGMVSSYDDYFSNTWSFAYTATTATVTDPNGIDTVYTIDTNGNVTEMVVADEESVEAIYGFTYDAKYRLTDIENPDNSEVNYTYDNRNRIKTIDLLDMTNTSTINMVEQSYHDDGRLAYEIDAVGNRTDFTYNGYLELTSIEHPDGSETTFTYAGDVNGLPSTVTDPADVERTYLYDDNGFNTHVILANGTADEVEELSQTFDLAGRVTARKLADKPLTTFTYDEAGDITQIVQGDYTTDFTYDTDGNLLSKVITDTSGTPTVVEDWSYVYNQMGWKTSETNDLVSEVTSFTYNSLGKIETTTDPAGLVTKRIYDERNRVKEVQLGDGSTMATRQEVTYDTMNRVVLINDGASNATERSYDTFGRLSHVIDAAGDYTMYAYNDVGQVTEVYRYKENGATDTLISRTQRTYNSRGLVTKVRRFADADGTANDTLDAVTETSYDSAGKLAVRKVAISGSTMLATTNTYAVSTGKLTKVKDPEAKETTIAYDSTTGLKDYVKNPLNAETVDSFDEYGRVSQTTFADDSYVTFEYNHRGQKIREIRYSSDAIPVPLVKNTWTYDGAGRQTEVRNWADASSSSTSINDRVTTNTYGTATNKGRLIEMTDPSGEDTTYNYDATYGYPTVTTLPDGSTITNSNFDGNGQAQTVTRVEKTTGESDKTMVTKYEFDELGRTVKITDNGPDGNIATTGDNRDVLYEFDAAGRRIKVTDAAGMVTETEYDDLDRKIKVTEDATGIARVTEFEYDNAGRMTKLIAYKDSPSSGKEETLYAYDGRGLVTSVTYEETGTVTMTYDAAGNMTERSDEAGVRVVYTYDPDTSLLTERKKLGATTDIEKFEYNDLGQLVLAQKGTSGNPDAVSKSVFTYGDLGQLLSEQQTLLESVTRTMNYTYYEDGRRKSLVNTSPVYYTDSPHYVLFYDSRGRVSSMEELDSTKIAEYKWRGNTVFSRTITCDYPGATKPKFTTTNTLDGLMRVTQMATAHQTSDQADTGYNNILTINYTYDDASNPLSALDNETTWNSVEATYSYDTLNRLVGASLEDTQTWTAASATSNWWEYDDLGNREESRERNGANRGYAHDDANRTTQIGPVGSLLSQTYDLAGNLTETAAIYDGKGYDLVYDHHNRLIAVKNSAGTETLQEFTYDALGRLIVATDEVNDETRLMFYDGVKRVTECDESGVPLRHYYHGPDYIDALVRMDDVYEGRPYYFVSDRMHSVRKLIDWAGAIVESYAYDAYGLAHIRLSAGRGDFDLDGDITSNDVAYHATVVSGANWNPIGDLDDDGDVDATDGALIAVKTDMWDGAGGDNAIVARAFSRFGNPFLFQGRPRFAIDTAVYEADGAGLDNFGVSCGIDGDYAVISSYLHDEAATDAGSVYVYHFNGSKWLLDTELIADDAAGSDLFGTSVAISGDTIVIGAALDDDNGASSGSVYVYVNDVNGWSEQQKLTASDGGAGDQFGTSVAIDGDLIVVGARFWEDGSSGDNAGAAYVFSRSGSTWSEDQILEASDQAANDWFGRSVDIDGERIVVGAHEHDVSSTSDAGQAYVFDYNSGTSNWDEKAVLAASDTEAEAEFGRSVTVSGDRVAIGAPFADSGSPTLTDSGAVYVFEKDEGGTDNWGQTVKLTASDTVAGDWFADIALDGDRLVVGANSDDDGGANAGSLYVFDYNSGASSWDETEKVVAGDGGSSDFFTIRAIDGDRILASSQWDDDAGSGSGSAYIFDKDNGGTDNWGEKQKIVALAPLQPKMPLFGPHYHRGRMYMPEQGEWATRDPFEYNRSPNRRALSNAVMPTGATNPLYLYEAFRNRPTSQVDPSGLLAQATCIGEQVSFLQRPGEGTAGRLSSVPPKGMPSSYCDGYSWCGGGRVAMSPCDSASPYWLQKVALSETVSDCGNKTSSATYSEFFEFKRYSADDIAAGSVGTDTFSSKFSTTTGGGRGFKKHIVFQSSSLCVSEDIMDELRNTAGWTTCGSSVNSGDFTCMKATPYANTVWDQMIQSYGGSQRVVDMAFENCNCCRNATIAFTIASGGCGGYTNTQYWSTTRACSPPTSQPTTSPAGP